MTDSISFNTSLEVNDYLKVRNQKFFRGISAVVHPLYKTELNNSIKIITNFLNLTVLRQAQYLRLQKLYKLSAEKCWNNKNNNYNYSEAIACEELIFEKDPILNNIPDYLKEIEVRIIDQYEKQVSHKTEIQQKAKTFQ
jgi:hypothetical protein